MSTCESVRVQIQCTDKVKERMETVYDRIAQRAYERWLNSHVAGGPSVAFWTAAERELISKPATEVREWGHGVTVQITCADISPSKVRLFMSATELLILAPLEPSAADRWLFRYLRFRNPVDNADASADFENGSLCISATFLNAPDEEKIHFRVA
jgi:Protein of unknown function (DUF2934)